MEFVVIVFSACIGPILLLLLACWAWWVFTVKLAGHPMHALRAWLGWGRSVRTLARWLDMSPQDLRDFDPGYRERKIAKNRGGMRVLQVPDRRTKKLQRAINRRVLNRLKAHPNATGFERHRSIVDNALPHVAMAVVIKMDVIDFFPSTSNGTRFSLGCADQ